MTEEMRMPPEAKKVAFVLLNLNQGEVTQACILSLMELTYRNVEIVLVDNGSRDGSGFQLKEDFPAVVFIRTETNTGFAEGNNVGMRAALARGADYVVLLNNDTVVRKDFVEPLLATAEADPTIAAQSCKIYFADPPDLLWYAGGHFDRDRALGEHIGYKERDAGKYDEQKGMEFATGCVMFIPRWALERVGMLENSFFIYFEDADWSLRALKLGYRLVYTPRAMVWHKVSLTTTMGSPFYLYFMLRNKILVLRRHGRKSRWMVTLPHFLNFYVRYLLKYAVRFHSWPCTCAILAGTWDGFRNATGENGRGRLDRLPQ